MARVYSALSADGRYAVVARSSACQRENHTIVARIDLESAESSSVPLVVYDDFRPERPPLRQARGVQHTVVLWRPAIANGDAFFLHAYTKLVDGLFLTPLDVWKRADGTLTRRYIALPEEHGRPRLRHMVATLSGDLLIVDDANELIIRIPVSGF
jgi:hypothetical protein